MPATSRGWHSYNHRDAGAGRGGWGTGSSSAGHCGSTATTSGRGTSRAAARSICPWPGESGWTTATDPTGFTCWQWRFVRQLGCRSVVIRWIVLLCVALWLVLW
jgi:hypothetical protein